MTPDRIAPPSLARVPPPPPVDAPAPCRPDPRSIDGMAAVLAHVVGIPRAQARAAVEFALAAGARGLEIIDGCA